MTAKRDDNKTDMERIAAARPNMKFAQMPPTNRTDGLGAAGVADAKRIVNSWYSWIVAASDDMDSPEGMDAETSIRKLNDQRHAVLDALEATRRSALVDAPAGEMVCPHNCEVGGICLAEHSGYPKSCPVKASPTPSVAALQAEIDRLIPPGITELVARHTDYADSAGVSTRMGDLRAVVAALLPPDTEGVAQPVAWLFERETDPTFPRVYFTAEEAAERKAQFNVGPLPVVSELFKRPNPPPASEAMVERAFQQYRAVAHEDSGVVGFDERAAMRSALVAALASPSPSSPEDGR